LINSKDIIIALFTELFAVCPEKSNEFFPDIFNSLSFIIDYAFKKPETYVKIKYQTNINIITMVIKKIYFRKTKKFY